MGWLLHGLVGWLVGCSMGWLSGPWVGWQVGCFLHVRSDLLDNTILDQAKNSPSCSDFNSFNCTNHK